MTSKLSICALFLLLSGCGTVLFNMARSEQADQWSYTLLEVRDGPNGYSMGGSQSYKPARGDRFVSATITFRNNALVKRDYSYDACDIDGFDKTFMPVLIDRDMGVSSLTDVVESFAPGQERTRKLIFSYPEKAGPTRVHCAFVNLPLK